VNETFFDNEPFIAKQTLFLRHDFVNRIVFNLIGLDWIVRTIGRSFLYVKEKVAQDVGWGWLMTARESEWSQPHEFKIVCHLSGLPFVLFHFIQNGGLRKRKEYCTNDSLKA
jgi:hypothetical protein